MSIEGNKEDSAEATKQITIFFLGASLLATIAVAYYRPEASGTLLGIAAAIVTALAAVVKK